MKILKLLFVCLFLTSILVACDKDEDENSVSALLPEKINAKWNVNSTDDYQSFEFNKSGNYIVVKNSGLKSIDDQMLFFGTYQINGNIITLSDLGKMTVSDINSNSVHFTLALNANTKDQLDFTATKQAEMASSTKTDNLCKTWELLSINDKSVKGTEDELTVLFSKAGTYYVEWLKEGRGDIAQWKWNDKNEDKFLYSWNNWNDPHESGEVIITELTKDKLVIIEDVEDDGIATFVLQPLQNSGSNGLKSSSTQLRSNQLIKKGLFRR